MSISNWLFFWRVIAVPVIVVHLWRSRSECWRCGLIGWEDSVWGVIGFLSYHTDTILHKFIRSAVLLIEFLVVPARWSTFRRIGFLSSWIINININVVVLHDNNLLVEIGHARKGSPSLWSLSFLNSLAEIQWFCLTQPFNIFTALYLGLVYWSFLISLEAC